MREGDAVSRFVKETLLGGYKDVAGGYSDSECTHVILTMKEYDKLLDEKRIAEQKKVNAEYEAERKIRAATENAEYRVSKAEQEVEKELETVNAELEKAKEEIKRQKGLNANLLRISKERANVDRKLKPKKEHTGYVVVSSAEKEYRYHIPGESRPGTVKLWETVIQSPYSVDFTEGQAEEQIAEDLTPNDGVWLVGKIGITGSYPGKYEELLRDTKSGDEFLQRNVMLSRSLRANFRTGYWETSFLHTKPLGIVPVEMRAK